MKLCVQGLWHLGSVIAACMASVGHEVVGYDKEQTTVDSLVGGRAPLFEPGLDELIATNIAAKRLTFTTEIRDATKDVEVLWVAFDTPVDEEDEADIDFVSEQIVNLIPNLPREAIVLVSSQLPVGSIGRLEIMAARLCPALGLRFAVSPENLRLGKALEVFLAPDRVVVGVRSEHDKSRLERLLAPITSHVEWMSVESAEMTKHAINAFLATSVAFANEIAAICELVGADAKEVERGLKTEHRIGAKAYLSPGGAFAGGTLARDITYLNGISVSKGLRTPLLSSVKPSNDEHKGWVKRRLLQKFPALKGLTVAIWGLTYKPGTDTLRRSMSVELCDWLIAQGINLRVHDPAVVTLPNRWSGCVTQCKTPIDTIDGVDALVVATEWPIYRDIKPDQIARIRPNLVVLDAGRFLRGFATIKDIDYLAVGTREAGAA